MSSWDLESARLSLLPAEDETGGQQARLAAAPALEEPDADSSDPPSLAGHPTGAAGGAEAAARPCSHRSTPGAGIPGAGG